MEVLKARISTYFTRAHVPAGALGTGAHEEWHELRLWERWTGHRGTEDGFQLWLSEGNPNYPGRSRRDTLYDDLGGVEMQLNAELGI